MPTDPAEKEIEKYQRDIIKKNFTGKLNGLLKEAEAQKNIEPKSSETRLWAVVYTELEKISAYVNTYLGA